VRTRQGSAFVYDMPPSTAAVHSHSSQFAVTTEEADVPKPPPAGSTPPAPATACPPLLPPTAVLAPRGTTIALPTPLTDTPPSEPPGAFNTPFDVVLPPLLPLLLGRVFVITRLRSSTRNGLTMNSSIPTSRHLRSQAATRQGANIPFSHTTC
jgi:hypothetical protein